MIILADRDRRAIVARNAARRAGRLPHRNHIVIMHDSQREQQVKGRASFSVSILSFNIEGQARLVT